MAKTWLRVFLALISIGIGYTAVQFWQVTRADDPIETLVAIGGIVAIASFVSMYFMTKGGGD